MTRYFPLHAALLIVLAWSWKESALSEDLGGVESVLDRLEQRLMEQEKEIATFGTEIPPQRNANQGNVTRYRYEPETVQPKIPANDHLDKLNKAIDELESEIENLSSDVQKVKHTLWENANIDTFVNINAAVENTDSVLLRTLRVKINGHLIYTQSEPSGLWMPRTSIPLFSGPLEPGKHTLALEARIVRRSQSKLPLSDEAFHIINQTFDIIVPDGKVRKVWTINIPAPKTTNFNAKADIEEKTI